MTILFSMIVAIADGLTRASWFDDTWHKKFLVGGADQSRSKLQAQAKLQSNAGTEFPTEVSASWLRFDGEE